MGSALIHPYGRTDRHDKSNGRFFSVTTRERLILKGITLCLKHSLPQKNLSTFYTSFGFGDEILTFIATLSQRVTVL